MDLCYKLWVAGILKMSSAGGGPCSSRPMSDKMTMPVACRVNLPQKNKFDKPRYQDYQAEDIKTVEEGGLKVRVMAGNYKGVEGPVYMRNPGMLMDVQLQPGATFTQPVRLLRAPLRLPLIDRNLLIPSRCHHSPLLGNTTHVEGSFCIAQASCSELSSTIVLVVLATAALFCADRPQLEWVCVRVRRQWYPWRHQGQARAGHGPRPRRSRHRLHR